MSYYQTTQVSIAGLGAAGAAENTNVLYEYTSPAVANQFQADIQIIAQYYANATTQSPPPTLTAADATNVANAIQDMLSLAQNGLVSSIGDSQPLTYYLTAEMGQDLDLLVRSFQAAGATVSGGAVSLSLDQLNNWIDLSKTSSVVQNTINDAINTLTGNTSLQALIETAYVGTANNLIESQLSTMQTALQTTTNVINSLSALQNIHNDLVVSSRPSFQVPTNWLNNSADTILASYKAAASINYGNPISPVISPTLVNISNGQVTGLNNQGLSVVNQLLALRTSLQQEIAALSALGPSVTQNPSSVYTQLKDVLGDLNTNFVYTQTPAQEGPPKVAAVMAPVEANSTNAQKTQGLTQWLMDFYNSNPGANATASNAGIIESNLTNAISAAQSINNTQQEAVRNFLFIFQQYYQSASAILQAITQIIQRMAQGIKQ